MPQHTSVHQHDVPVWGDLLLKTQLLLAQLGPEQYAELYTVQYTPILHEQPLSVY